VTTYGLTHADRERLGELPYLMELVPVRAFPQEMHHCGQAFHRGSVVATTPAFADQAHLILAVGRFLNDQDGELFQNVAVLGSTVADALFPDQGPLDQTIRVSDQPFRVIGLLQEQTISAAGMTAEQVNSGVYLPLRTCQARFGNRVAIRKNGTRRFEACELSTIVVTVPPAQAAGTRNAIQALLQESHQQKDWEVLQ